MLVSCAVWGVTPISLRDARGPDNLNDEDRGSRATSSSLRFEPYGMSRYRSAFPGSLRVTRTVAGVSVGALTSCWRVSRSPRKKSRSTWMGEGLIRE